MFIHCLAGARDAEIQITKKKKRPNVGSLSAEVLLHGRARARNATVSQIPRLNTAATAWILERAEQIQMQIQIHVHMSTQIQKLNDTNTNGNSTQIQFMDDVKSTSRM